MYIYMYVYIYIYIYIYIFIYSSSTPCVRSMLGGLTAPWCDKRFFVVHGSQLQPSTQTFLRNTLPWALVANPERCVASP